MPPVATVTPNGPEIRRLRSLRGWEARNLAEKIGRHPKSIGKLERGGAASLVLISQVAMALEVDPSAIILEEDDAGGSLRAARHACKVTPERNGAAA